MAIGAFGFNDLDLTSQNNVSLSAESAKQLFRVDECASIPARFHMAQFPEFVPRMFGLNSGLNADGSIAWDHWFTKWHLVPLAKLVNEDVAWLNAASEDDKGLARGAVIFRVASPLYEVQDGPRNDRQLQRFQDGQRRAYVLS